MAQLKRIFSNKGIRLTNQRRRVFEILNDERVPMNAESIYIKLLEQDEQMSLSTVYRILDLFEEKGIVVKTYFDNKSCYAINDGHKHFLTCLNCKTVVEIEHCPVPELEEKIESSTHFLITSHRLDFYGLCPECQV